MPVCYLGRVEIPGEGARRCVVIAGRAPLDRNPLFKGTMEECYEFGAKWERDYQREQKAKLNGEISPQLDFLA